MPKQRRRPTPKPEAQADKITNIVVEDGGTIATKCGDRLDGRPCPHAVTEELAYDEPSAGRYVAANRRWQCGAVKRRDIGTKWVPPGEKMNP